MHPIRVLWAVPRSASTAFERMMIERGDHTVFDEPFSATYYFSEERVSDRFTRTLPRSRASDVLDELRRAAGDGPVFVKDMAYHAAGYLDASTVGGFVNTFLIRDPRRALPSLARRWPDFTDDETGYRALLEVFGIVRDATGEIPVVIDAADLRAAPAATIEAWCSAVGIAFEREALRWEPGMQPQWRLWPDWYVDVAASSGFLPADEGEPPEVTDHRVAEAIRACLPVYEELAAHALEPVDPRHR